jgi:two-component SAPR family response regulator
VRADSTDLQFERALIEARSVNGEERLARLRDALRPITGTYLAASDLEWVAARRYQLDLLEEEAVAEIADLALRLSDYEVAREFSERLLARNPYNHNAYRILIDVETAVGTKTAAVALHWKAIAALREIGLGVGADASLTISSLVRQ